MKDATMPLLPTTDPAKFSKEELLKAFLLLQEVESIHSRQLCEVKRKLHDMNLLANVLSSHLYELVDAFDAGSQAQINDHLRMLSEQRKQRHTQKAKVH